MSCQTTKRSTPKSGYTNISSHVSTEFPDSVTIDTVEETAHLTVNSDPHAEDSWDRFHCSNAVRGVNPECLKALQQLFAHKPPGQYLVKLETRLEMRVLDFEPAIAEPDQEAEANDSYYANYTTQEACLNTAGVQIEAQETSDLP